MNGVQIILGLGLALLSACTAMQEDGEALGPASCAGNITAYGSREELKADPASVAARLAEVPTPATAIGYGPADGYRAELTLLNGVWSIAYATAPGTVRVETVPEAEVGATFFVSAAPAAWSVRRVNKSIATMAGLETLLADAWAASGCSQSAIPFRLTGTISAADWSVVGRPEGAKGQLSSGRVTLVGIYDPVDSDRYFMPAGQTLHVHLVTEDGSLSGHLSSFLTLDDGFLSLPAGF